MSALPQLDDHTVRIPAPRLLPPVTPDRQDRLRLTRRGRIVRDILFGAGFLSLPILAQPISDAYFGFVAALGGVL